MVVVEGRRVRGSRGDEEGREDEKRPCGMRVKRKTAEIAVAAVHIRHNCSASFPPFILRSRPLLSQCLLFAQYKLYTLLYYSLASSLPLNDASIVLFVILQNKQQAVGQLLCPRRHAKISKPTRNAQSATASS